MAANGPILAPAVDLVDPRILDPRVLLLIGILVGVLLLGALVIALVDRWRKRQVREENPVEELTSFRALRDRGELSQEEYDRICRRMAGRMRGEGKGLNRPPGPTRRPAGPVPPPPPAPPAVDE